MEENEDVEVKQMEECHDVKQNGDEESSRRLLKQQNIIQQQNENIQVTCDEMMDYNKKLTKARLIQECIR